MTLFRHQEELFLHGRERLLDQTASYFLFVFRRHLSVADHMDDPIAEYQPIGTDHFCHRQGRGDLHRGDAGFFQLRGDRSAAARAGPSRGSENDRVDTQLFGLSRDLASHTPGVRQRIGQP